MRLIDAYAFKEHLASFVVGGEKTIKETTCGNEWIDGVHTAYREIDEMPTIEINTNDIEHKAYSKGLDDGRAIARPHGEWKYNQYDGNPIIGNWHCSECRHIVFGGYSQKPYYNFCPNCGADMREGEESG